MPTSASHVRALESDASRGQSYSIGTGGTLSRAIGCLGQNHQSNEQEGCGNIHAELFHGRHYYSNAAQGKSAKESGSAVSRGQVASPKIGGTTAICYEGSNRAALEVQSQSELDPPGLFA